MLQFVFWTCISLVLYTYIGYAIVIFILVRLFPYRNRMKEAYQNSDENNLPSLTLFITAYNESAVIPEKMLNCLALDYPADKLKILWVIDGSTDHSHELLKQYPMVEIINSPLRKGKKEWLLVMMIQFRRKGKERIGNMNRY